MHFQDKIEKMHFFRQFKDNNSGRKHENYTSDSIHLLFLLYLLVTFISEFENTYNSFSNLLLRSTLVCKIPQFFAKSYWFGQLIILFQKVDTLRLLKIYRFSSKSIWSWLNFVQENWLRRHTSCLLWKWLTCFRVWCQTFRKKLWVLRFQDFHDFYD